MTQLRNPFTSTGALGVNHPLFRGRVAELDRLARACLHAHDSFLLVYGGRQNGKTSLVLRLETVLRAHLADGVRVCRIDFQGLPGASSLQVYRHLAHNIAISLPQAPQPPDTPDAPALLNFLEQNLASNEVTRSVVLLDQLDTLPETTREDLAHILRALHTRSLGNNTPLAKFQCVLTGGIELYNSNVHNVCEIVQLGDLDERDAIEVVADGLTMVGVEKDQAVGLSREVYACVHGHPYLTQRLGKLLAQQQLRGAKPVETQVEELARRLLGESDVLLDDVHRNIVNFGLEDVAQWLLASGHGVSRVDNNVARLELLGVARREGDHWVPRNPLLAAALAQWLGFDLPAGLTLLQMAEVAKREAPVQYMHVSSGASIVTPPRLSLSDTAVGEISVFPVRPKQKITIPDASMPGFRDALADAFDEAGLDEIVREISGGRRLDRITSANGLDAKALDVVTWANRSGWLSDLFEHAIQKRPGHPLIAASYIHLQAIVAHLPEVTDPYESWELRTGGYFVDRVSLRETIRQNLSYANGRRVLAVSGPSSSGKTHCVSFLQHVRDESAIWVVPIDLEDFVIGGQLNLDDICQMVAMQIGLPLPENSEQLSRLSSFFGVQLVRHLESEMKECWIIFDSLNKVLIPESIIEFILRLVKVSTQSTTRLRIVLLGVHDDDELMRKVKTNAVREDLGPINNDSLVDFFVRLCEHMQRMYKTLCDERAVAEAVESVIAARDIGSPEGAFERQWIALLAQVERLYHELRTIRTGGAP